MGGRGYGGLGTLAGPVGRALLCSCSYRHHLLTHHSGRNSESQLPRRLGTLSSWGVEGPVPDLGGWVKYIHMPPGQAAWQVRCGQFPLDIDPNHLGDGGGLEEPMGESRPFRGLPEVQEALTSLLPQ